MVIMVFCSQATSKTIIARSFKLVQLIKDLEKSLVSIEDDG